MELLYVWIEDYKNIKKQGFNFSPKHWFDFEYEQDEASKVTGGTLNHKDRNPNYPKKFFGENISNVTAIVGKNGSGKSSLMEFIFNWHYPSSIDKGFISPSPRLMKPFYNPSSIFIFQEKASNSFKIITTFLKDAIKTKFEIILSFNDIQKTENTDRINLLFNNGKFFPIYYSSIFSEEQVISESENPYLLRNRKTSISEGTIEEKQEKFNLSTTNALLYDNSFGKPHNQTTVNTIYNIYLKDQLYSAKFIADNPNAQSLNLPPYTLLETDEEFAFLLNSNDLSRLPPQWSKILEDRTQKWQETSELIKLQIINQLLTQYEFQIFNTNHLKQVENVDEVLNEILYFLSTNTVKPNSKSYLELPILIEQIKKLCKTVLIDWSNFKCFDLLIENEVKRLSSFIEEYKGLLTQFRIIQLHLSFNRLAPFSGLSSGEQFLLKMYGRLWRALDSFKLVDLSNKTLLIMLDEVDLTLHPEWQKSLLERLRFTLNTFFKNYNIQLVLASHSPFLVSDLPKENIIFLNKDKDGMCEVKPPEDMTHTFGANIHSLYRNSFFLENGLMGEFAKGKIDEVIKDLNQSDKKPLEKRHSEIKYIIEQIGEPLIKDKLLQKYKARFEPIEDQINELRLKIEKLEASRKN